MSVMSAGTWYEKKETSELGKELTRRRIAGRNFEYRVGRWYKDQGYYVMRHHDKRRSSAFPDLLVAKDGAAFFVEVKLKLKYFSKREREAFRELFRKHGIKGFVAYNDDKHKIRVINNVNIGS